MCLSWVTHHGSTDGGVTVPQLDASGTGTRSHVISCKASAWTSWGGRDGGSLLPSSEGMLDDKIKLQYMYLASQDQIENI